MSQLLALCARRHRGPAWHHGQQSGKGEKANRSGPGQGSGSPFYPKLTASEGLLGKCKNISTFFFSFPTSNLSPESSHKAVTCFLVLLNIHLFTVQNIYTTEQLCGPLVWPDKFAAGLGLCWSSRNTRHFPWCSLCAWSPSLARRLAGCPSTWATRA